METANTSQLNTEQNMKANLLIMVIIFALTDILVLGLAFYLFQQNRKLQAKISELETRFVQTDQPPPSPSPSLTPTPTPMVTLTPSENVSGWQEWIGDIYRISFPAEWQAEPIVDFDSYWGQTLKLTSPTQVTMFSISPEPLIQDINKADIIEDESSVIIGTTKVTGNSITATFNDTGKTFYHNTFTLEGFEHTYANRAGNVYTDPYLFQFGAYNNSGEDQINQLDQQERIDMYAQELEIIDQILATFELIDTASQSAAILGTTFDLDSIEYQIPDTWDAKVNQENLFLSADGGGYLLITAHPTNQQLDPDDHFCLVIQDECNQDTEFTNTKVGNLAGYRVNITGKDPYYFGSTDSVFYVVKTFNPPSPNTFEKTYQTVLDSLKF